MDKNRIEGRHGAMSWHPPSRRLWRDEQHSEVVWFTRGGKCGGCAGKHRALTWGDLAGAIQPEVSPDGSGGPEAIVAGETSRGRDARINNDTGGLPALRSGHAVRLRILDSRYRDRAFTRRRAEPNGSVLTAGKTPQPKTPDGEAWTRAGSIGSMWALRTGLGPLLTRACPASDRNRRVRTRTHGGVGPVAGSRSQSRGPDSAAFRSSLATAIAAQINTPPIKRMKSPIEGNMKAWPFKPGSRRHSFGSPAM